jgi:hypothetical protein
VHILSPSAIDPVDTRTLAILQAIHLTILHVESRESATNALRVIVFSGRHGQPGLSGLSFDRLNRFVVRIKINRLGVSVVKGQRIQNLW